MAQTRSMAALRIPTGGGRELGADVHEPTGPVRAQVVIHGATATPATFYGAFARHLASRGVRVLTYDYRGIGRSRSLPLAKDPVTMAGWIDDAEAAQAWLHTRDASVPLVAVGHSFGGQIAATLGGRRRADALLLVGAQSGYWRRFPWPARARIWVTWTSILPVLVSTFGYLPAWSGIGEDLPGGVARQWARWCLHERYLLSELPELHPRLASYQGPVLALSFSDDEFAPVANVRWMLEQLSSADVDHEHIRPLDAGLPRVGHFGFFRRAADGALWRLADAFVDHVVSGGARFTAPALPLLDVMADLEYGRTAA